MEESINQEKIIIEKKEDLIINEKMKSHLLNFAKWGKFLGIVTYVFAGLMFLLGIAFLLIAPLSSNIPGIGGTLYKITMFGLMFVYGILYFYIANLLLKTTNATKIGIQTNNQKEIERGAYNLQKLFMFLGILTIIGICIYALVIIIVGIGLAFVTPILS